jgi:hypothetical protein
VILVYERSFFMHQPYPKQRCAFILMSGLVLVMLVGCSIIPQPSMHSIRQRAQPITAAHQPFRVVQFCLDSKPFMPDTYFTAAKNAVADRINQAVTVNQDGLNVYVSLITHDSFQHDVLAFQVPGFPADPPAPPHPAPKVNPYANASAQSDYRKAYDAWQANLIAQHQKLAALRAQVKTWSDKLRLLPNPYDNTGADPWGCLDSAATHFTNVAGEKYLLIASPLVSTTTLQRIDTLSLSGARVRVIWHACIPAVASVCETNDARWKQLFLSYGAQTVTFFDVAQSEVEKLTF